MRVVEADNILGDVGAGFSMVGILALPYSFHLEAQEESFHDGIIPAVAFTTHACDQVVPSQQITVGLAGILATPVCVYDQTWLGLT